MKKKTSITIDQKLLSQLKQFAKSEKRSVSAQVGVWLEEKFAPPKNGKAAK